jgi:hypothetical protein
MAGYEVEGYGNVDKQNAFAVLFSEDLSALVTYYCYDNNQTFPATDSVETANNEVLAGTDSAALSMVSLVDTTNASPGASWKPGSATPGEANPNRMQGNTSYVQQDGTIRSSSERITFNMVVEVPDDALTSMAFGFDLKIVYSYTGATPTVDFQVNTGTEGSPSWQTIEHEGSSAYGILHCRINSGDKSGGDGNYYANIPESGTEDTVEGWADQDVTPTS